MAHYSFNVRCLKLIITLLLTVSVSWTSGVLMHVVGWICSTICSLSWLSHSSFIHWMAQCFQSP